MASHDDQKLIDDIARVLDDGGRTETDRRVINSLQTHADAPSAHTAQEARSSLESLFQTSGVMSQETLHKLAALEALGQDIFYEGIGPDNIKKQEKAEWERSRKTTRALVAQAIQAESMRQFNESMEALEKELGPTLNNFRDFKQSLAKSQKPGGEAWNNDVALITAGNEVQTSLAKAKDAPTNENLRAAQRCLTKLKDSAEKNIDLLDKELAQIEKFDAEFAEKRVRTLDRLDEISKNILDQEAKALINDILKDARSGSKIAPDDSRLAALKERQKYLAQNAPGSDQERQLTDLLALGDELFTNRAELHTLRTQREKRVERLKEIKELSIKQSEAIDEALQANNGITTQDIRERRTILAKYSDEEAKLLQAIKEDQKSISNFQVKSYESVVKRLNIVAQNDEPSLRDIAEKNALKALNSLGYGRIYEGKPVQFANHQKIYFVLDENNKRVLLPAKFQYQYREEDRGNLVESVLDNTVLPATKYGKAAVKSAGDAIDTAKEAVKETASSWYDWAFGSKNAAPEAKETASPQPEAPQPATKPSGTNQTSSAPQTPASHTDLTPEEIKELHKPEPGQTPHVSETFNAAHGTPIIQAPQPEQQPAPKQSVAAPS